ncbi:MAG: twin-arginine translocase subunit TatC [Thermomicrobiales bacterium]
MYSTLTILAALVAAFFIVDWVFKEVAIQANISNEEIPTLSPTESFVTWFKVLLYIAIALSMPMLVFQILRYIAPGLTNGRSEQSISPCRSFRYSSYPEWRLRFSSLSRALEFLSNFKSDLFLWSPRASELVTFYLRLMLGIGIAFELPALMFVLGKLGIVNHSSWAGRAVCLHPRPRRGRDHHADAGPGEYDDHRCSDLHSLRAGNHLRPLHLVVRDM